jgi:saccharopine dehydrogenase (NAD+, L-lysine-forming)
MFSYLRGMKIGLLREIKKPFDKRVPLSPGQCRDLKKKYSGLDFIVQSSGVRCFKDSEYINEGIPVQENLSACDILMGVKEVDKDKLIPGKTYMFFSHITKRQEHNKALLKAILGANIRLIDYELLTDINGLRIIGFGRFGGLVGAYSGLRAFALRHGKDAPKPAYLCKDLKDMKNEISNFEVPNIRIAVTGGGRAAHGAMELLNIAGVKKITVEEYLNKTGFDHPVYVQLEPEHYVKRMGGSSFGPGHSFELQHFIDNPEQYENNFERFIPHTDMLISAAHWDPHAPVLFTTGHTKNKDFAIKVIADITCDINGSIPTTKRVSTIEEPFYDYNRSTGKLTEPFSNEKNITVMAVDNLPSALPKDASESFGEMLCGKVIPALLGDDTGEIIRKAAITLNGNLTENFKYLEEWVHG